MRACTLLLLGLLLSLSGCTIEAKGLGAGRSQSQLISGRVFDSEENVPLKGATVKTADGKTATTDDNGEFTIEASPGKSVLTIEEADHAKGVKEVEVYADAESYVEMFAKPVDKDDSLDAATGGQAKVGLMTVVLPPDALEDESGVAYNGKVTIEVATVRPENAQELSAFPGKFDGTTVRGMAGSVATQAAASIRLLNAAGRPLRMRPSQQIEIFVPIRPAVSRRSTRLWKLREESADWEEVDFPAVRDVFPGTFEPALRTAVSVLTWWNAGEPFVKSRIQGCLSLPRTGQVDPTDDVPIGSGGGAGAAVGTDAGVPAMRAPLIGDSPLAGIQVVATGVGYGYFAERYTDANGCFDIEVKADGPVALYAQTRMLRSAPRFVVAASAGATQDIGMLTLAARDGNCPGLMQDCGGVCVNTYSDDNNCGECGIGCAADVLPDPTSTAVPIHCVSGRCGCDDTQDDTCFDGACANIETDSENCGGCGTVCATDHECVDSVCVPVASSGECVLPMVPCNGACLPSDEFCPPGSDRCPPGQVMCSDGSCIDPLVDGCSSTMDCGPDPITGAAQTYCPGTFGGPDVCVDTMLDVNHCGGCAPDPASQAAPDCFLMPDMALGQNACATGCTTEAACQASLECGDTGLTACATPNGQLYCTDLANSQFCGSCRNSCASDMQCSSGVCVPRMCPAGQRPCGYFCRDAALSCGESCGQGETCFDGVCLLN